MSSAANDKIQRYLDEIGDLVESKRKGRVVYGDKDAVRKATKGQRQSLASQGRSGATVSSRSQNSEVLKHWGPLPRAGTLKKLSKNCCHLHPILMEFLTNVLLSTLAELRLIPDQVIVRIIGMELRFDADEISAVILMERALYDSGNLDGGDGFSVSNLFELIDLAFETGSCPPWLDTSLNTALHSYVEGLSALAQHYEFAHSDLKADNVFVTGQEQTIHLKIADLDKASFSLGTLRLAPLPPKNLVRRWAEPSYRSACAFDPRALTRDRRELCVSMLLRIAARLGGRASLKDAWIALPKTFGTLLRKTDSEPASDNSLKRESMMINFKRCTKLLPIYSDNPKWVLRRALSWCLFDDTPSFQALPAVVATGTLGAVLWAAHRALSQRKKRT